MYVKNILLSAIFSAAVMVNVGFLSADVSLRFEDANSLDGWNVNNMVGVSKASLRESKLVFEAQDNDTPQGYVDNDPETDPDSDPTTCRSGEGGGGCELRSSLRSPFLLINDPVSAKIRLGFTYVQSTLDGVDADSGRISLVSSAGRQELYSWSPFDCTNNLCDMNGDTVSANISTDDFEVPLDAAVLGGGPFQIEFNLLDLDSILTVSGLTVDSVELTGVSLVPEPEAVALLTPATLGLLALGRRRKVIPNS